MGYTAYSYVGAYVKLPQVEKNYTKTVRRCSDENCSNHKKEEMPKDARFCIKCGTEIEEIEVKAKKTAVLKYYEFAEEHGLDPDHFSQVQNSYNVLIPNYSFGALASWDEDDEITKEIDFKEAQKIVEEYKENAQNFIDKVKEIYGIELQVKFGVVSYTM